MVLCRRVAAGRPRVAERRRSAGRGRAEGVGASARPSDFDAGELALVALVVAQRGSRSGPGVSSTARASPPSASEQRLGGAPTVWWRGGGGLTSAECVGIGSRAGEQERLARLREALAIKSWRRSSTAAGLVRVAKPSGAQARADKPQSPLKAAAQPEGLAFLRPMASGPAD